MRVTRHYHESTKTEIAGWPDKIKKRVLHQLRELECGNVALRRKGWRGNGWAGFEISVSAYRVVGTLEDPAAVIVFHAFRKDSGDGKKTRQHIVDLIEKRHRDWAQSQPMKKTAGQRPH
jgi:phage-related protein